MSRIGKAPIDVPAGVSFNVDGLDISVEGKLGKLYHRLPEGIGCQYDPSEARALVSIVSNDKPMNALWGLSRSIVANMVQGVHEGYKKTLEIIGVGYKASTNGKFLALYVGHSHDIMYPIPAGITIKCEKPTIIVVSGCDKQMVGQVAAQIKGFRPPEPYKGKGIRISGEFVFRKVGKKK